MRRGIFFPCLWAFAEAEPPCPPLWPPSFKVEIIKAAREITGYKLGSDSPPPENDATGFKKKMRNAKTRYQSSLSS